MYPGDRTQSFAYFGILKRKKNIHNNMLLIKIKTPRIRTAVIYVPGVARLPTEDAVSPSELSCAKRKNRFIRVQLTLVRVFALAN